MNASVTEVVIAGLDSSSGPYYHYEFEELIIK
jgi:hypothetical protein